MSTDTKKSELNFVSKDSLKGYRFMDDGTIMVGGKLYAAIIVGAGLYGLVTAREVVERTGWRVLVMDRRDHIGGNAWSKVDEATGAEVHLYGAHLFHTNDDRVWEYVNQFSKFTDYTHRVYATHKDEVYPLPINLGTMNQFFHAHMTPNEAREMVAEQAGEYADVEPQNLAEQGCKLIGKPLFDAFIKEYTAKQWQTPAEELPASVIRRLPVRFDYDNRYFTAKHEGLPVKGYHGLIEGIANHSLIDIVTGVDFLDPESEAPNRDSVLGKVPVLYTGPVDEFFGYSEGELSWRTVDFDEKRYAEDDHFGCPVMNFSDADVPYTRAIEFKNFNPERKDEMSHDETVVWYERSRSAKRGDEPYYPVNTAEDRKTYERYETLEKGLDKVAFGGRLGTYAYYDMDKTIGMALDGVDAFVKMMGK